MFMQIFYKSYYTNCQIMFYDKKQIITKKMFNIKT